MDEVRGTGEEVGDEEQQVALARRRVLVGRAMRRRCPVCATGHIFNGWFHLRDRCPGCGLRFRREEGQMSGDLGINVIVSFGALLVTLLAVSLLTWPNLPAVPLIVASLAIVLGGPVAFYPYSKMLWLVIDLSVNPLRPGEATAPTR
jgi:uncharacterized protein (DUF983 family)